MDIELGNRRKNTQRAIGFIEEAVERCSRFIVLPELWTIGYSLSNLRELAEPLDGPTVRQLVDISSKHDVYILGSIAELRDNRLYNTVPIIGSEGMIGSYSKTHLWRPMCEHRYFSPGDSCHIFETKLARIGTLICYDIRFPEMARSLALQGATIIFVSAEWPYPRLDHWRILLQAMAIENLLFVVASNRVGLDEKYSFFGHSMIIDPMGRILAEAEESESILTYELDLDRISKVRDLIPCFEDRKPGVYSLI